jgi:hypothetical protein
LPSAEQVIADQLLLGAPVLIQVCAEEGPAIRISPPATDWSFNRKFISVFILQQIKVEKCAFSRTGLGFSADDIFRFGGSGYCCRHRLIFPDVPL